jgi:hypothetical protein
LLILKTISQTLIPGGNSLMTTYKEKDEKIEEIFDASDED